jgi:proteasome lid subunit RPN8/RPN11
MEVTRLDGPSPLAVVRIGARQPQSLGRRTTSLDWDRMIVPTLQLDHSELALRQAGISGEESLLVWAGTVTSGTAFVSTVVIPALSVMATHGQVTEETVAETLRLLDEHDLVAIAQLHSHPRRAFLSEIDRQRPFVSEAGFLSIVVPRFAFVDLADPSVWSIHEYRGVDEWREFRPDEVRARIIVDPSILVVGP